MTRFALLVLGTMLTAGRGRTAADERIAVTISGGHETDPRDHGRPVVLIAAALGVTPEVFREAFSRVRPAPAGTEPDPAEVRRNKAELLGALGKFGVTNETLDRVSNYYRYRPGGDRIWPIAPASAYATIHDGVVTAIVIAEGGAGYSAPPQVAIPGHPEIALKTVLAFGRELSKNGSIASIAPQSR